MEFAKLASIYDEVCLYDPGNEYDDSEDEYQDYEAQEQEECDVKDDAPQDRDKSPEPEENMVREVIGALGLTDETRFPGMLANTYTMENANLVAEQEYAYSMKWDGERSLFCIRSASDAFFLHRSMSVSVVDHFELPERTRLTILDGEWLRGVFIIFDALMVGRSSVIMFNLADRMRKAAPVVRALTQLKCFFQGNRVKFKVQWYVCAQELEVLMEKSDVNDVDGVMLTPLRGRYMLGRANFEQLKWKSSANTTVDVKLEKVGEKVYMLAATYNLGYKLERIKSGGQELTVLNVPDESLQQVCEVAYARDLSEWYYVKVRSDKIRPNSSRTVYALLAYLRQPISQDEFVKLAQVCTRVREEQCQKQMEVSRNQLTHYELPPIVPAPYAQNRHQLVGAGAYEIRPQENAYARGRRGGGRGRSRGRGERRGQ